MAKRDDWEKIRPLGGGGQSDVFLVRTPARVADRKKRLQKLMELAGQGFNETRAQEFAQASLEYAREERLAELGALKKFKPRAAGPQAEQQALERKRSEIAVLQQNRPGLPELMDSDQSDGWIVTEYFPMGTLEDNLSDYTGRVGLALTAFRSLVETVAALHADKIVHRDIKPANVFAGNRASLILGDFGIVFLPNAQPRISHSGESVGPADYIPPWADTGERLESVDPNFDVYMLGKLLWCMVAGRLRLFREWHRRPDYDLCVKFPSDPHMHMINRILDKCVVEHAHDCLSSAADLLLMVDECLAVIRHGGQMLAANVPRPCRVCGKGFYRPPGDTWGSPNQVVSILFGGVVEPGLPSGYRQEGAIYTRPFACDSCGHLQFFRAA